MCENHALPASQAGIACEASRGPSQVASEGDSLWRPSTSLPSLSSVSAGMVPGKVDGQPAAAKGPSYLQASTVVPADDAFKQAPAVEMGGRDKPSLDVEHQKVIDSESLGNSHSVTCASSLQKAKQPCDMVGGHTSTEERPFLSTRAHSVADVHSESGLFRLDEALHAGTGSAPSSSRPVSATDLRHLEGCMTSLQPNTACKQERTAGANGNNSLRQEGAVSLGQGHQSVRDVSRGMTAEHSPVLNSGISFCQQNPLCRGLNSHIDSVHLLDIYSGAVDCGPDEVNGSSEEVEQVDDIAMYSATAEHVSSRTAPHTAGVACSNEQMSNASECRRHEEIQRWNWNEGGALGEASLSGNGEEQHWTSSQAAVKLETAALMSSNHFDPNDVTSLQHRAILASSTGVGGSCELINAAGQNPGPDEMKGQELGACAESARELCLEMHTRRPLAAALAETCLQSTLPAETCHQNTYAEDVAGNAQSQVTYDSQGKRKIRGDQNDTGLSSVALQEAGIRQNPGVSICEQEVRERNIYGNAWDCHPGGSSADVPGTSPDSVHSNKVTSNNASKSFLDGSSSFGVAPLNGSSLKPIACVSTGDSNENGMDICASLSHKESRCVKPSTDIQAHGPLPNEDMAGSAADSLLNELNEDAGAPVQPVVGWTGANVQPVVGWTGANVQPVVGWTGANVRVDGSLVNNSAEDVCGNIIPVKNQQSSGIEAGDLWLEEPNLAGTGDVIHNQSLIHEVSFDVIAGDSVSFDESLREEHCGADIRANSVPRRPSLTDENAGVNSGALLATEQCGDAGRQEWQLEEQRVETTPMPMLDASTTPETHIYASLGSNTHDLRDNDDCHPLEEACCVDTVNILDATAPEFLDTLKARVCVSPEFSMYSRSGSSCNSHATEESHKMDDATENFHYDYAHFANESLSDAQIADGTVAARVGALPTHREGAQMTTDGSEPGASSEDDTYEKLSVYSLNMRADSPTNDRNENYEETGATLNRIAETTQWSCSDGDIPRQVQDGCNEVGIEVMQQGTSGGGMPCQVQDGCNGGGTDVVQRRNSVESIPHQVQDGYIVEAGTEVRPRSSSGRGVAWQVHDGYSEGGSVTYSREAALPTVAICPHCLQRLRSFALSQQHQLEAYDDLEPEVHHCPACGALTMTSESTSPM